MVRDAIKHGKAKIFNLTQEEIDLTEHYTGMQKFKSQSEFIGWLVRAYHNTQNPIKELESIKEQRDQLSREMERLAEKEKDAMGRVKYFEEAKKENEKVKLKAIRIIRTRLIRGDAREEIEAVAKGWAMRTNSDASELLFKASRREDATLPKMQ